MKDKNWINEMSVYFYGNDIEKWEKICKDAEEGKVPTITLRGVEYALVKHGKWIDCTSSDHYKCSKCGCKAPLWWDGEEYEEWLSQYCPHCGAKMDEVKDNEYNH